MNNWYVITGGPSSGKTTLLNLLKKKGFTTTDEVARVYIDQKLTQGYTLEKIRKNEIRFQLALIKLKIQLEQSLAEEKTVFLDRGMHDTIAYLLKCGYTKQWRFKQLHRLGTYKKVFILNLLNYVKDYARTESANEALIIDQLLEKTYHDYGFQVVRVPILKPEKRMEFVLNHL